MIITRRRRGEGDDWTGEGRDGGRESGAEGESEGDEGGGERACCLLHATKNEVGNPSAEAWCVRACTHTCTPQQKKLLSNNSADGAD